MSRLGSNVILGSHPLLHPVFETLGYSGGYAWYRRARNRRGDVLGEAQRWSVIAAATIGALIGSRILGLLEQAKRTGLSWHALVWPGGKTVVGGLLGGWVAVELTKKLQGIHERTGDLFVLPLCVGIAIGRVGCFLAGLADDTYGTPTSLPWGVDFGDGVSRHPTQLYEVGFLCLLAFLLHRYGQRPHPEGAMFRLFLMAYLSWRLVIDVIKPQPLFAGLSLIQWSCVVGLLALAPSVWRIVAGRDLLLRSSP